ncbi:MAG: hypothetical protein WB561_10495 [Terracidiphilus sp.]
MNTMLNPDLATELRYALDVLEERSHLGMDNEYASRLRDILLRRIEETETALSARPAYPVKFCVSTRISA